MSKSKPLEIKYQGKRKEINLTIEDCPDDIEIRKKLKDKNYKAEWKTAYLDSHYEEKLNNQRESREDRHTSLESFDYEDERYFSSESNPHKALEEKETIASIMSACNENQREILRLYYIEGYYKTEIAKMRNIDESSIRKTINRAIKTIERKLK